MRTESTKKRLLTKKKLTFVSAVELTQSLETASKDAQQQKDEASGSVHNVTTPKPRKVACYRCGQMNHHKASECQFKEATCHNCGKKGHTIKAACRTRRQPQRGKRQFHRRKGTILSGLMPTRAESTQQTRTLKSTQLANVQVPQFSWRFRSTDKS